MIPVSHEKASHNAGCAVDKAGAVPDTRASLAVRPFVSNTPIPILAFASVSALGRTLEATTRRLFDGSTGLAFGSAVVPDTPSPLGEVSGPLPPLPDGLAVWDCRANRLLAMAMAQVAPELAQVRQAFGPGRVGVVIGTSASGNTDLEQAYAIDGATGYDYHHRQSFGACATLAARLAGVSGPAYAVSTACSSGANAMISAAHLIRAGLCDAVIVGATDAICRTTVFGFQALGVTDPDLCRPFDADRRGLNLGEGAAVLVLGRRRPDGLGGGPDLFLAGWGATSEAHHMTQPDPEGDGSARTMAAALACAGLAPADIGYLNLHGTATPQNDTAEARGVAKVFGTNVAAGSTKGYTGHLLGAAAAVEAVISLIALRDQRLPPSLNLNRKDPDVPIDILDAVTPAPGIRYALSNSFAFGGNDTSLIFGVRR